MIFVILLVSVLAGSQAVDLMTNGNSTPVKVGEKSVHGLKESLENIRSNLMSMKPTIDLAAGLVDSYAAPKSDSQHSIDEAFQQLSEKNIPHECLQEATAKLAEIKAAVNPNCSAVIAVEDLGAITYNFIHLTSVSMVTLDEVLNGLEECGPWYKLWNFLPCVIKYAWSSYHDLSNIITAAVDTYNLNEARAKDIVYQVFCKKTQLATQMSAMTANQVMNEAYLCSKNTR